MVIEHTGIYQDLFYGPEYSLSWVNVLCALEKKMCALLLVGVFYKCQLGKVS